MYVPFDLIGAFTLTFEYLWLHIVFAIANAFVFTIFAGLKELPKSDIFNWIVTKFLSLNTFAFLGLGTSYFLSRGVTTEGGQNAILAAIAPALLPVVAGGIALLEQPDAAAGAGVVQPRAAMAVFLLTAIVSYQMFVFQTTTFLPVAV